MCSFLSPESAGAKAVLVVTALLFVAMAAYEIALLAYTPKDRSLHFTTTVVMPYKPFLIMWSLFTGLSGLAFVAHRKLHAFFRRFSFVQKHWGSATLSILATMTGIVIMELGLRIFDPLGIKSFPIGLRYWEEMMVPDPELRHRLRRNTTAVFDDVEFKTNSDAMRDDEPLEFKPDRRILVLGDSVALGTRVAKFANSFHLLEDLLGGRNTVDVVNSAVSSYNTVQQSRLLQRIGDDYAPDLVLLLYVDNDDEMDHVKSFYPREYWRQWVYFPRAIAQRSYVRHTVRLGLYPLLSNGESLRESPSETEGWMLSRVALNEINSWCQARDVPFLVVFYSMSNPQFGKEYFEVLSEAGSKMGFPVVDSATYWKGTPLSDLHIAPIDTHVSPLGHALLAEGLSNELRYRYPALFPTPSDD